MKIETPTWMNQGAGQPPDLLFSFRAEAGITGFDSMREAEDYVVADEIGTLYRLDPLLNVKLLTRLQEPARQLSWSDTGEFGSALLGNSTLVRLDAKLKVIWTIEIPFTCSAIAIDPYGIFTFVASSEGGAIVIDDLGKKAATFETMRPLSYIHFMVEEPVVIAAASHGLMGAYALSGKKIWEKTLWSNVGDLALIQKTARICLAASNQGIQVYDGSGDSEASLILEGTVNKISVSYTGKQAFASTVEKHVYRLDEDGELKWAATSDVAVTRVDSHPIEPVGLFVFEDRTILRAQWY
ncbi:hypothetical protein [Rubinisphaera sp.]|uniref:hypothetical protein n=1 Tax=Rubinisphaera sp. TaxID=2024857 RepID=UPI000ED97D4F|nr:hypothetical protein [Rubinisphaera sp.]HCS50701.1 hypothetical protein [Planctomycetaceae bacterium]|tara:strand:- start:8232 stop:9122 length:891 start_codon:yes stop_codon:yes gene_type:complete